MNELYRRPRPPLHMKIGDIVRVTVPVAHVEPGALAIITAVETGAAQPAYAIEYLEADHVANVGGEALEKVDEGASYGSRAW